MIELLKDRWVMLVAVVVAFLVVVFVVLYIGGFSALIPGEDEVQREFLAKRAGLVFVPGEVKILSGDAERLIFPQAHLEGRIISEPRVDSQSIGVLVSFQTIAGDTLQATVLLGENDKEIGTLTADKGVIGGTEEWRTKQVAEIVPLLMENDPIQIRLNIHEISDESLQEVMGHQGCKERVELCSAYLEEMRTWYTNNSLLIDAIENSSSLPEDHKVGAVSALVLFDDE